MKIRIHHLFLMLTLLSGVYRAGAQGTVFTYQGRLNDTGGPANGTNYGMVFYLYDAPTNGNLLGNEGIVSVTVSNGLFTVPLNFGNVFDGNPLWLEISVQKNGGSFSTLSPRQQIQPAPYAVFANTASNVSGTISSSQLSGPLSLAQLPGGIVTNNESSVNLNGSFTGNGGALTNLQLSSAVSPGTISLQSVPAYFTETSYPGLPNSVTVADVNGDGKMDLIYADIGYNTLDVLTNNGSGSFGLYATINEDDGLTDTFVTTADIDGDGRVDLIALDTGISVVTVFTNNGSGFGEYGGRSYSTTRSEPQWGYGPASVAAADVDGDGLLDLITANENGTVTVLKNYGDSLGFDDSQTYWGVGYAVGADPQSILAMDINGDGLPDLITANYGDNTLTILTNNGSGYLLFSATEFGSNATIHVGAGPKCVVAADVNNDGFMDLITANYGDNTLTILTNNGNGSFGSYATINVGSGPVSVTAADVNGDGHVDLACVNYNGNTLTVLTNNGSGTFQLCATLQTGLNPTAITSADFNGDGNSDLASADTSDGVIVFSSHTKIFSSGVASTFSGNVGIGTTSPNFPLSLGSGDGNKIALWDGGANDAMGFGVEWGQFIFFLPDANNRFSFLNSPSGAEIATIYGNGNFYASGNITTSTNIFAGGNISAAGAFSGNGSGLNNLNYNNITNPPVIPSTNGLATANFVVACTNGLATTNFVTAQTTGLATTNYVVAHVPTTANYVFAYDTNSEAGYIFFQGATFANVVQTNGWTYSVINDAGDFTCPQTGLYMISYTGEATGNTGDTFSMAVITSGILPGSQASVYFPTSSAGHPVSISKSFIASLNAGTVLELETSGTAPSCHLTPDASVSGSLTPSISLTIVRIQ